MSATVRSPAASGCEGLSAARLTWVTRKRLPEAGRHSREPLAALALAAATLVLNVYIENRREALRLRAFTARFGSLAQIRETHDLERFRRIEAERGRIQAVGEIRRAFPGISLFEAFQLLDG